MRSTTKKGRIEKKKEERKNREEAAKRGSANAGIQ